MSHGHSTVNCVPGLPQSNKDQSQCNTVKKTPTAITGNGDADESDITKTKPKAASAPERRALLPKDEIKILKNWGFLKKNIIMGNIVDPLIEKGIYTPDLWMTLKRKQVTDQERVEEFLYHILSLRSDAYGIFLETLKNKGYGHVVSLLEGTGTDDKPCSRVSYSGSSGSVHSRVGRPQNATRSYSLQYQHQPVSVSDPRNGASGAESLDTTGSAASGSNDQAVRQEDLHKMKDEITEELRQLRRNIEMDRDQDRLELQILQRKHTEMSENLNKANTDRENLEQELSTLNETVEKLQAHIDKKVADLDEIKKMNDELKRHLEDKTGDLQRQIQQKQREKDDIQRALRTKEIEYKRLQNVLETIKEEHEDRLTRLKTINKDKITLERQVQSLGKEKRNLEVKIRSLEQHIRVLQENFSRDSANIKLQLEKTKTLLEEKEKAKTDLEKQLQESVRENENLRQKNMKLEESLQKTQDEKEHLQLKVRQAELSSYSLPQFLTGSKSNRPGWKPNRTNWK